MSVILPFRDACETVERALLSLLRQTLREIEVLAVDDGSMDAGGAVVENCMRKDDRIRLLRTGKPSGVVAAVNMAWAHCRAPLIARMDADDVSLPHRLGRQYAMLERDKALSGVGCLVEVPDADEGFRRYVEWSNELVAPEDICRERFVECPVVNPTVLVRREALESVGGHQETPWAEDYDLWLRFLGADYRMAKVPEILYLWHDDQPDRLTRSDPRYSRQSFLRARAHYLARLPHADRGFALCGAGPTGKMLARFLVAEGAVIHRFYEVNHRRVGQTIAGIPVCSSNPMPAAAAGGPILLSCVGSPGGRERVRRLLSGVGYVEGEDFFCCS